MPTQDYSDNEKTRETDAEFGKDDLAKLFNYPAVGELFSGNDTRRLDEFCEKMNVTKENLERIVRYGTKSESEGAARAVRGIEVTLEFLNSLQKMRLSQGR